MKRITIILLACMACVMAATAQQTAPFDMSLWNGKLPNTNGSGANEVQPFIRVHLPSTDKATGKAVVVCPGGGYQVLAIGHEGNDWAQFFNERGIACIVLSYRMPQGNRQVPLSDACQAINLARANAKQWSIDPNDIGIMGSSAGGHLASSVSTHAPAESRPNFAILFYPVITMDKTFTHMGSHDSLLGNNASSGDEWYFSNEKQIQPWTPETILLLADDDNIVPVQNSVEYYLALKKQGKKATMHIYPNGGHGFGYNANFRYRDAMLKDLGDWLSQLPSPGMKQ